MMYLGAHVSISKGLAAAVRTAIEMKANTMQYFSRNPRGGSAKALDEADIREAVRLMTEYQFGPLVAHAPYTFNLASAKPEVRAFTIRTIKEDLLRIKAMQTPYLVVHVGSHGGQGEEAGIQLVVQGLQEILPVIPEGVNLLLEIMAGAGTELGHTFEQLHSIISDCANHPQLGLCLDTCHLTGGGYDLSDLVGVKGKIEDTVGLARVKAIHLNDSKHSLGSRRDRHAKIGEGTLGIEIIKTVVSDEAFKKTPFILETPNDDEGYAAEIALLKELVCDENN
jgi:deoxyribonuclease-4